MSGPSRVLPTRERDPSEVLGLGKGCEGHSWTTESDRRRELAPRVRADPEELAMAASRASASAAAMCGRDGSGARPELNRIRLQPSQLTQSIARAASVNSR